MNLPMLDNVQLDTDEGGFILILDTDTAGTLAFRLPLEVGEQLDAALAPVREHAAEGRRERAAYDRATPEERGEVLRRVIEPAVGRRPRRGRLGMVTAIPVESDVLWPRTPAFRFRLYGRSGRTLRVLAAAPDAGGLGVAIVQLDEDARQAGGELGDYGAIGVLDVIPDDGSPRGRWIVSPWSRPG